MTSDLRHRIRKLEARVPDQPPPPQGEDVMEKLGRWVAEAPERGDPPSSEPLGPCPAEPGSALARLWAKLDAMRRAAAVQAPS